MSVSAHEARPPLTPVQRVILTAITAYKGLISPLFAGSCRFVPSCSEYARLAVIEHGALRGSWLAARRLARCHPAGAHGFDPVPPRAPSQVVPSQCKDSF